jgi:acyl carrier protein
MERPEIEKKLVEVLVDELGIASESITMDATFEEDLEVDSLGVVELLMALEDTFGVKIPDEEAEAISTVGEAVDLVMQKLAG